MKHAKRILGILLSCSMAMSGLAASASEVAYDNETEFTEVSNEDTDTALLREDYYAYINSELLSEKEIPAGSVQWSWSYELTEDAYNVLDDTLQEILENKDDYAKGSDEQIIADFYLTYLDTDTRNSAGLGPFQEYLDDIQGASNIQEYMEAVSKLNGETGIGSIIEIYEGIDSMDSTRYMEEFYGMDLGLGKEIMLDDSYDDLMPDYQQYIAATLQAAGYDGGEAGEYADEIIEFMKDMAEYSLDAIDFYDADITYNVYTLDELEDLFTNFDAASYLEAGGYDNWGTYTVVQEDLFRRVNEVLTEDNLDFLKAYSSYSLVDAVCDVISMDVDAAYMQFEMEFEGLSEEKDPERRASEVVQSLFGFEFGKLYVARTFTEDDKQAVTEMVESMIDYYRERIGELDWLSDDGKEEAVRKLDTMIIKVGYPDVWPDYYENLEIKGPDDGGSLVENYYNVACSLSSWTKEMAQQPVDRTAWDITPQTVNAYYDWGNNEIVFPAAILQAPFYSAEQSEAENYGGIGVIIAHEITHAFDSNGSNYDEYGNFNPWWTEEDAENFEELTQKVVDYYDTIEIAGRTVNGAQTVNENIADLGALNTVTSYFENDAEALDELFRHYAFIWATNYTDEYLNYWIVSNKHSPASVRVNAVLKTLDCFYETYPEIQEGDGMYLAPEDRVRIW